MKEKNKIKPIAIILIFILMFQYLSVIIPLVNVNAETYYDGNINWQYEIDGEGNAINVKMFSASGNLPSSFTFPETIDGHTVISIESSALFYQYSQNVTDLTIPKSIQSIHVQAFIQLVNLVNINVSNENEYYVSRNGILYSKDETAIIKYPPCNNTNNILDTVNKIGAYAFYNCSFESISLPNNVTEIGTYAFLNCSNLQEITIPNGLAKIEKNVFYNCTNLRKITLPESVDAIDSYAFKNCTNLSEVVMQEGLTKIWPYAFENCTSLSEITLPNSITGIYYYAFKDCTNLSEIIIPSSAKHIEEDAFLNCNNLTIKCYEGSVAHNYAVEYNINYEILEDIQWSYTIYTDSDGDKYAKDLKPRDKSKILGTIDIPNEVDDIEVYSIAYEAFKDCTNLVKVTSYGYCREIGSRAFYGCTNLTSIMLPRTLDKLGKNVFSKCTSLQKISAPSNSFSYYSEDGVLYNKSKTKLIKYPAGKTETEFTIPETVTSIDEYAFEDCVNLTKINIPESVKSIGTHAFHSCANLTNITLPSSIEELGSGAFVNCTSLTEITIPNGVTNIGPCTFQKCTSLTKVTIPDSVTNIGYAAFEDCTNLTNITIPQSLTKIEQYTFRRCTNLTEINIPQNVSEIEIYAFLNCTNLNRVVVKRKYITLGTKIFGDASDRSENLTIVCKKNSSIYNYAINNQINLEIMIEFTDENLYNKLKLDLQEKIITFNDEEKYISMELADINNITELDISNNENTQEENKISSLTGLENFTALEKLIAQHNKITTIGGFSNLQELDLRYNELTSLYPLRNITDLKKLNVSHNNILNINTNYKMEELDASFNKLGNVPTGDYLNYIKKLNLDNNCIKDVSVLENANNLEEVTVKNQQVNIGIVKNEYTLKEIAPIFNQAKSDKYSNGENITFEAINCNIQNDKVILSDEINFESKTATITIHGGKMDGTVCGMNLENSITVNYEIDENNSKLYLKVYRLDDNSNKVEVKNASLKYALNDSENYLTYDSCIPLKFGTTKISVKMFEEVVLDEEINIDIPLSISAIRKNEKIYIISNADVEYSFSADGNFNSYSIPISDSESHEKIYVKINKEQDVRELNIITYNSDDCIYDAKVGDDYAFEKDVIYSVNGKIDISNIDELQYSYTGVYGTWEDIEETEIEDKGTDIIYFKSGGDSARTYKIIHGNRLSKIFGSYSKNDKNYIYSQIRQMDDVRITSNEDKLIINDEEKIHDFNKKIIDVTNFDGEVLILTDEQKVYRVKKNNEIVEIEDGVNIKQIEGIYAVNNNNEILKCSYVGTGSSSIKYSVCGEYSFNKNIEKINTVYINEKYAPLVLLEDGNVKILQDSNNNIDISNCAIDIASERGKIYILENNKVRFLNTGVYTDRFLENIVDLSNDVLRRR